MNSANFSFKMFGRKLYLNTFTDCMRNNSQRMDLLSCRFSPMATSFLIQGAEAKVYEGTFCGRPAIFKQRFVKTYRLPQLDEHLTKVNTLFE